MFNHVLEKHVCFREKKTQGGFNKAGSFPVEFHVAYYDLMVSMAMGDPQVRWLVFVREHPI